MVVARNGKTWQIVHHFRLEPSVVSCFKVFDFRRVSIIIRAGRYASVIFEELVFDIFLIHQPLGITEKRNLK